MPNAKPRRLALIIVATATFAATMAGPQSSDASCEEPVCFCVHPAPGAVAEAEILSTSQAGTTVEVLRVHGDESAAAEQDILEVPAATWHEPGANLLVYLLVPAGPVTTPLPIETDGNVRCPSGLQLPKHEVIDLVLREDCAEAAYLLLEAQGLEFPCDHSPFGCSSSPGSRGADVAATLLLALAIWLFVNGRKGRLHRRSSRT